MKKIPTLFIRTFEDNRMKGITRNIMPGCEEAFRDGIATVKVDGACCAVIHGKFYKRYDAKPGKIPPVGAIPCCDPDPVTGHWPHWVRVNLTNPDDKWFVQAYRNVCGGDLPDGTYEAFGPHFNGNPYNMKHDMLIEHGTSRINVGRSFECVKQYLTDNYVEGLVFWLNGEPVCKIKRTDFGLPWPIK
jgi:hypothetical protein